MADWDGLRRDLERDVSPPAFQALRDKRRHRQQRRTIAVTCAVALIGTASGVALLGQHAQQNTTDVLAKGTAVDQVALGDKLPPKFVYQDYVVTDVDFVSPDTGWAIGLRCADETCDVQTWRTDDGGASWRAGVYVVRGVPRATYSEQDPAGGGVRSLRMVDAKEGFAFNPDLYVTHDGARTWTRVPQPTKVASLSVVDGSVWAFERGCAADDDCDAVLRTGTLGRAFKPVTAEVPATAGAPTILRRSDATHGYLVSYDQAGALLRRTADGGRTWEPVTHPCPDAMGAALSAGRERPLLLVCTASADDGAKTSVKHAYTSSDAGTSWRQLPDLPAAGTLTDLMSVSPTLAYATTQSPGSLLVTTDGGATWRPATGATTKAYGYANLDAADSTHVWAMGDAGRLWRTVDGRTWRRLALPPGGPKATGTPKAAPAVDPGVAFTGLSFLDADRGYATGHRCAKGACRAVLRRTDDGGRTWSPVNAPTTSWQPTASPLLSDVSFADASNGWLYGPAGIFSTHDAGATWHRLDLPGARSVLPRGTTVWVADNDGMIHRGPVARDHLPMLPGASTYHGSFDAFDATHAYIVTSNGGADPSTSVTADGGKTWVVRPAPCASTLGVSRRLTAWAVDQLWVICDSADEKHAVARSSDGGAHWQTVMSQEVYGPVVEGYAASASNGFARLGLSVLVTGDGGRTWRATAFGTAHVEDVAFLSATQGWVLTDDGLVHRTTDGEGWTTLGRV